MLPSRMNALRPSLGLAATLGATLCLGCASDTGSDGTSPGSAARRPRIAYTPKTDGSVYQRMTHIDTMIRQFTTTDEGDPAQARAAKADSSHAIIVTAKSVLATDGLDEIDRNRASRGMLDAYLRQIDVDPTNYQEFVSACDDLIARFPQTELATLAAFLRLNVLASVKSDDLKDTHVRIDRIYDAALILADQNPPHTNTPDVLSKLARELEQSGDFSRSAKIYGLLLEKFPDPEKRRFGPGHLRRVTLVGQPVGEIQGVGFDDKEIALEQFRGKVVLVDFWASWCEPCLGEFNEMKSLYERLGPKGLEILGINCDDEPRAAVKIIKDRKLTWPQIVARTGEEMEQDPENNLEIRYGIEFLPTKLLVDREGNLVWCGYMLSDALTQIEKLLPPDSKEEPKAGE